MTSAVEVRSVTKIYRGAKSAANRCVSLEIAEGEFFGLLGANGAGKSTLVRQMLGLISPDEGQILLSGRDIGAEPDLPSRMIAYMPQTAFALNAMTVAEAVFAVSRLRGYSWGEARLERDRILTRLGLAEWQAKVARDLSGGQRRLVQLAVTLAAAPNIMILDEPTNELDPVRRRDVWTLLREEHRERGKTIVLITHNALEAEQVIERVGIMKEGQLVAVGRPADLKRDMGARLRVEITLVDGGDIPLPGYLDVEVSSRGTIRGYIETAMLGHLTDDLDLPRIADLKVQTMTLEDLYLDFMA